MKIISYLYSKFFRLVYLVDYISILVNEDLQYLLEKISLDFDTNELTYCVGPQPGYKNITCIKYKYFDADPNRDCHITLYILESEYGISKLIYIDNVLQKTNKSDIVEKYFDVFYKEIRIEYEKMCKTGITNKIRNDFKYINYLKNPQYGYGIYTYSINQHW